MKINMKNEVLFLVKQAWEKMNPEMIAENYTFYTTEEKTGILTAVNGLCLKINTRWDIQPLNAFGLPIFYRETFCIIEYPTDRSIMAAIQVG
ncbi:MAG: hypothetical protein FWC55_10570 [Firmicutes bacterium]|nr:hypothetical protein [Bacillota bacterium]